MDLITLDVLKERLDITHGNDDSLLERIIDNVSSQIENFLGCYVQSTTHTEYFDVVYGQDRVQLRGFPVTSITSVHNDTGWLFTSDSLMASTGYAFNTETGVLYFTVALVEGPHALKVIYVGGMAATTQEFMILYGDVCEAAINQCAYVYNIRRHIGASAVSAQSGNVSWVGDVEMLGSVMKPLERRKLPSI